jgi:predicted amidophosphoribosyltransferase
MLARQTTERWADELEAANVDVVVPVPQFLPQSWWRRYNAAAVLAEEFSRILRRPLSGWSLVKTRWTPSQAQSSPSDRRQQQRGAFGAVPWRRLRGRTVLLVDDVLTTGGTSQAATRALLKAGARKVLVAVVARGIGR